MQNNLIKINRSQSYPLKQNQGGLQMLVLTRKAGEGLLIGDDTKITVLNIDTDQIKLGVNDSEGIA